MLKGMIFDKDGTLFDFHATWGAWAASVLSKLSDGDPVVEKAMADAIDYDLDAKAFRPESLVIAGTPMEIAHALHPHLEGWSVEAIFAFLNAEAEVAPQAEVVPLPPFLDALEGRGMKLGVATNDAEAPARANLASANVEGRFSFIVGSDSGFGGKPAPGQLLAFLDQTGLQAGDVAMVGDSTHDLHAGRAAGMVTIAVLTGMATREDLEPFADVVLKDIGQIPDWIDGQNET